MQVSEPKRVLILGARGLFGLAAARAFAAAGWRVVAQIRPGATAPYCAGAIWLPVAAEDTAALVQAAQGAAVVVHALNPAYTAWESRAMPLLHAALRVAQELKALLLAGDKLAALIGPEPHTQLSVAVQQSLQELDVTRRIACHMPSWA